MGGGKTLSISYKTIGYISVLLLAISIGCLANSSVEIIVFAVLIMVAPFFVYCCFKNDHLLIAVMIYFYILDPCGNLISTWIKPLLLVIIGIKSFKYLKINTGKMTKTIFLTISIVLPVYGITISIFRGNQLDYIITDASHYMFFIVGYLFLLMVKHDATIKFTVTKHLLISTFILSIVTILMYISVRYGVVDIHEMDMLLRLKGIGMALIEINGNFRFFLAGQIFIVISTLFLFNNMLDINVATQKMYVFTFFINIVAIVISNTRGLWLGLIIGCGMLFMLKKFSYRKTLVVVSLFLLLTYAVLFLDVQLLGNLLDRIASISDFSGDNLSNHIRFIQSRELINEFLLHPILGGGFGAILESGYMRGLMPYLFELSYLELLYKLGVVGMSLFVLSLSMILIKFSTTKNESNKSFLVSAYLSFLIISTTNPYIVSSLGMFLLSMLFVFTEGNVIESKLSDRRKCVMNA